MQGDFAFLSQRIWMALLVLTLLAAGCSKSGTTHDTPVPEGPAVPEVPETTPPGTPVGMAEQVVVGPEGGIVTTADDRLQLVFPAGAVQTATTVTIQPITNNCPGATGNAYRITPHINFAKPVTLGFSYGDSDYVASFPAALTIAYQDDQGRWQAAPNMVKDTANKKVWVTTDHFSDWSLYKAIELIPYSTVVEPGQSVALHLLQLNEFKNDSLLPLPEPVKKRGGMVQEWKLAGEGALQPKGDEATYTAPGAIPAKNPVAVSAVLKQRGNWQVTLVSNIYIGNEGLYFRIDNGPWMYCVDDDGIFFDGYFNTITAANLSTEENDGVTIRWVGTRTLHSYMPWRLTWPYFLYGPNPITNYMHILQNGQPSPGGIYLHHGMQSLPYAIGTFYLRPALKITIPPQGAPTYSTHNIEGYFRLKWKN